LFLKKSLKSLYNFVCICNVMPFFRSRSSSFAPINPHHMQSANLLSPRWAPGAAAPLQPRYPVPRPTFQTNLRFSSSDYRMDYSRGKSEAMDSGICMTPGSGKYGDMRQSHDGEPFRRPPALSDSSLRDLHGGKYLFWVTSKFCKL
jgi:hypothetical protein